MGYRSYYNLTVTRNGEPCEDAENIIEVLRTKYKDAFYAIGEDGGAWEDCSWHNDDGDMKEFSKEYPDVLFEIFRTGDEQTDMVYTYYKDGKMQECAAVITYPPIR